METAKETKKPQLHASMIGMLYGCGEMFRRRYGARFGWADREEIIPPGVALITGISTHRSVEENLTTKIETGELMPLELVEAIARDAAVGFWNSEVRLQDDEAENIQKVQGECIDTAVSLAGLHARELAPMLAPVSVERKWVITMNGFPYDLAGQWDIEEHGPIIRDTKTSAKSPNQDQADSSEQLSMYTLAKCVCDGEEPTALYLDTLVKLKVPKIVTLKTERGEVDRQRLLRRIERATEIIEKGAFTPANSQDWRCSPKWCGYFNTCPFGGGQ